MESNHTFVGCGDETRKLLVTSGDKTLTYFTNEGCLAAWMECSLTGKACLLQGRATSQASSAKALQMLLRLFLAGELLGKLSMI